MIKTIPELLQWIDANQPEGTALKEEGFELNYPQLLSLSRQAAKAFMSTGVEKGDRIAVWAPNVYEWIIAALGAQCAGAVLVPVNTRWKGEEAAFAFNNSEAKLLFTLSEFVLSETQSIRFVDLLSDQSLPALKEIVLLRGEQDGHATWNQFLTRGEQITDAQLDERMNSIDANDVMDILYTSGTTGKPKGVICSHAQNLKTVSTWADTVGLNASDNYLIINPFFHSFGYKAGWLAALIKGAKILPVMSFVLDDVMAQIERDQVSMLPGPPTIYQSLLTHPKRDQFDLSSLRLAVTGAAPVSVKLIDDMRTQLNFETVVTAYGLTETCGFVSICRPNDAPELISTTSGAAMEGVEVKCVDAHGESVEAGQSGEIWVRGYNVMQGYFNNPTATDETITYDGWLKTGDIGVLNEAGYLTITDRLKDMFICGGFNVYPAELENTLANLDGIQQVAVIGVSDERMGEVGKAYIVKSPTSAITDGDVIAFCKSNMSNYKVPRVIEFIETMPVNASGKILKKTLREWNT